MENAHYCNLEVMGSSHAINKKERERELFNTLKLPNKSTWSWLMQVLP